MLLCASSANIRETETLSSKLDLLPQQKGLDWVSSTKFCVYVVFLSRESERAVKYVARLPCQNALFRGVIVLDLRIFYNWFDVVTLVPTSL